MLDLEELLHMMRDQPSGKMVRCSKARAMFAMRACRKSIMIGMALTHGQMASVGPFFIDLPCPKVTHPRLLMCLGCPTYGYDASAVELSARPAHNAPSYKHGEP